jgi:hypothetical protein
LIAKDSTTALTLGQKAGREPPRMRKLTIDEKTIRDQLKAKRSLLFEEYSKNPMNTRSALDAPRDSPSCFVAGLSLSRAYDDSLCDSFARAGVMNRYGLKP